MTHSKGRRAHDVSSQGARSARTGSDAQFGSGAQEAARLCSYLIGGSGRGAAQLRGRGERRVAR